MNKLVKDLNKLLNHEVMYTFAELLVILNVKPLALVSIIRDAIKNNILERDLASYDGHGKVIYYGLVNSPAGLTSSGQDAIILETFARFILNATEI